MQYLRGRDDVTRGHRDFGSSDFPDPTSLVLAAPLDACSFIQWVPPVCVIANIMQSLLKDSFYIHSFLYSSLRSSAEDLTPPHCVWSQKLSAALGQVSLTTSVRVACHKSVKINTAWRIPISDAKLRCSLDFLENNCYYLCLYL